MTLCVIKLNPMSAEFARTMQFGKHKLSDKTYEAQEKRFKKLLPGDLLFNWLSRCVFSHTSILVQT